MAEVRESGEAGVASVRSATNVPAAGLIGNATGGGAIEVYSNGVAVANIRPGKAGGGYLQLLDAAGRAVVEAGSGGEGVGVVRAGPNFKCGSNYLGLKVPDCIVGLR